MTNGSFDIPVPGSGPGQLLLWTGGYPDAPANAITRLNKVCRMEFKLTASAGPNPDIIRPVESPQNMQVSLPLQFSASIPDVTVFAGTASNPPTQAEVLAVIAALQALQTSYNATLAQLRNINVNPSA